MGVTSGRESELRRLEHDKRGQDDEIGALLTKVVVKQPGAVGRALQQADDTREQPPGGGVANPAGEADDRTRGPLAGPLEQRRRIAIPRFEEPQVEARAPQARRQLPPGILRD